MKPKNEATHLAEQLYLNIRVYFFIFLVLFHVQSIPGVHAFLNKAAQNWNSAYLVERRGYG